MKLKANINNLGVFLGLILTVNAIIQILLLPYTELNKGIGYDGMHYIYKAVNWDANIDSYHAFRLFPSLIVNISIQTFNLEIGNIDIGIRMFQVLNFVVHLLTLLIGVRICKKLSLSNRASALFLTALILNAWTTKHAYYSPVMTDSVSLMLSTLMLLFFISRNKYMIGVVGFMGLFTMPLLAIMAISFMLFPFSQNIKKEEPSFKLEPYILPTLITLFTLYNIIDVYFINEVYKIYSYIVNEDLVKISIVFLVMLTFWFYKIILYNVNLRFIKKSLGKLDIIGFVFFILYSFIFIFIKASMHTDNDLSLNNVFWNDYAIAKLIQPLLYLVDFSNMYGLFGLIFIIYFNSIKDSIYMLEPAFLLNLSIFGFFFFVPESRIVISFIPILAIIICKWIDNVRIKPLLIVFGGLILSKCWYPMHYAKFGENYQINELVYSYFPAQHYYQFIGVAASFNSYITWLIINTIILIGIVIFFKRNANGFHINRYHNIT